MPSRDNEWGWPTSKPRPAAGGIRARTQRGGFGATPAGAHWVELLEGGTPDPRMQRGRRYARSGQVVEIALNPGVVSAKVQGSRPRPYRVEIGLRKFSAAEQGTVSQVLDEHPALLVELSAGHVSDECFAVLRQEGVGLLPASRQELTLSCSCPDWGDPCKHEAAVLYLVAEELDRSPIALLMLRGLEASVLTPAPPPRDTPERTVPLDPDLAAYWGTADPLPSGDAATEPRLTAPVLERLGPFPFWRGQEPLRDQLVPVYQAAAAHVRARILRSEEASSDAD